MSWDQNGRGTARPVYDQNYPMPPEPPDMATILQRLTLELEIKNRYDEWRAALDPHFVTPAATAAENAWRAARARRHTP